MVSLCILFVTTKKAYHEPPKGDPQTALTQEKPIAILLSKGPVVRATAHRRFQKLLMAIGDEP